jgi:2'-5' RNA ligase
VARLFVAVWPPESLLQPLRELERPARPGLRWTTEDQWHVTVRFLGRIDAIMQGRVQDALEQVAAEADPVDVTAGPAPRGLGRGVWVLPVDGLEALAARVALATGEIGQPPPARPFRGHITLARARRPDALAALRSSAPARGAGLSARWLATELTLVQSDLRPDGARYEVLQRWQLRGGSG